MSNRRLVSIDLGQVEARVIAMLTKDANVVKMFTEDYDVHLEWAKKLVEIDPRAMSRRGIESMSEWRSRVKNEFVFPSYFGAGKKKIARLTGIREPLIAKALDAFWKKFRVVRGWQKDQLAFYERHQYVESPLGFRRHAPLKYNMIINTPIQSTASDICVGGLIKCNRISYERELDWWTPIMNIHDDLTFVVPESEVDAFIPEAVRAMIDFSDDPAYDFINVPLTCEVEVGPDWASMEKVGTFRSDQLA